MGKKTRVGKEGGEGERTRSGTWDERRRERRGKKEDILRRALTIVEKNRRETRGEEEKDGDQ